MIHRREPIQAPRKQRRVERNKMIRAGMLAIVAVLLCGSARAETALEVQSACQQLAKISARPGAKVTIARTFENGVCWGAFAAFQGFGASTWPDTQKPILGFCAPPESTRLQFVDIFTRYMKRHNQDAELPFVEVAIRAFAEAYPCPPGPHAAGQTQASR
jgi:hypothetical protein